MFMLQSASATKHEITSNETKFTKTSSTNAKNSTTPSSLAVDITTNFDSTCTIQETFEVEEAFIYDLDAFQKPTTATSSNCEAVLARAFVATHLDVRSGRFLSEKTSAQTSISDDQRDQLAGNMIEAVDNFIAESDLDAQEELNDAYFREIFKEECPQKLYDTFFNVMKAITPLNFDQFVDDVFANPSLFRTTPCVKKTHDALLTNDTLEHILGFLPFVDLHEARVLSHHVKEAISPSRGWYKHLLRKRLRCDKSVFDEAHLQCEHDFMLAVNKLEKSQRKKQLVRLVDICQLFIKGYRGLAVLMLEEYDHLVDAETFFRRWVRCQEEFHSRFLGDVKSKFSLVMVLALTGDFSLLDMIVQWLAQMKHAFVRDEVWENVNVMFSDMFFVSSSSDMLRTWERFFDFGSEGLPGLRNLAVDDESMVYRRAIVQGIHDGIDVCAKATLTELCDEHVEKRRMRLAKAMRTVVRSKRILMAWGQWGSETEQRFWEFIREHSVVEAASLYDEPF